MALCDQLEASPHHHRHHPQHLLDALLHEALEPAAEELNWRRRNDVPVHHAIWTVEAAPRGARGLATALGDNARRDDHRRAVDAIERMAFDRAAGTDTDIGGRVDLVAIAPDGSLVLIELKRDRTPREVAAQAIDYASWLEKLEADDIAAMYERFSGGRSLSADFQARFGHDLDDDSLNQSHQIIIVASTLGRQHRADRQLSQYARHRDKRPVLSDFRTRWRTTAEPGVAHRSGADPGKCRCRADTRRRALERRVLRVVR